jgi:rhomboid protease GluP
MEPTQPPQFIKSTWLSQKPRPASLIVAATSSLLLAFSTAVYWLDLGHAASWMPVSREAVFVNHEYWRLLTATFAHADTGHLVSNLFLFFVLGFFLYGYFGFALFPIAAFFGGALANLAVLPTYAPKTELIGASGIVYWMGGAWLMLYFFIARQKARVPRWLRTMGVALLIFAPQSFESQISYRVHFAGFVIGCLAGTIYFLRFRKKFRAAEVLETDVFELDPGDDLPPPQGPSQA